jgi:hypothetical protein
VCPFFGAYAQSSPLLKGAAFPEIRANFLFKSSIAANDILFASYTVDTAILYECQLTISMKGVPFSMSESMRSSKTPGVGAMVLSPFNSTIAMPV